MTVPSIPLVGRTYDRSFVEKVRDGTQHLEQQDIVWLRECVDAFFGDQDGNFSGVDEAPQDLRQFSRISNTFLGFSSRIPAHQRPALTGLLKELKSDRLQTLYGLPFLVDQDAARELFLFFQGINEFYLRSPAVMHPCPLEAGSFHPSSLISLAHYMRAQGHTIEYLYDDLTALAQQPRFEAGFVQYSVAGKTTGVNYEYYEPAQFNPNSKLVVMTPGYGNSCGNLFLEAKRELAAGNTVVMISNLGFYGSGKAPLVDSSVAWGEGGNIRSVLDISRGVSEVLFALSDKIEEMDDEVAALQGSYDSPGISITFKYHSMSEWFLGGLFATIALYEANGEDETSLVGVYEAIFEESRKRMPDNEDTIQNKHELDAMKEFVNSDAFQWLYEFFKSKKGLINKEAIAPCDDLSPSRKFLGTLAKIFPLPDSAVFPNPLYRLYSWIPGLVSDDPARQAESYRAKYGAGQAGARQLDRYINGVDFWGVKNNSSSFDLHWVGDQHIQVTAMDDVVSPWTTVEEVIRIAQWLQDLSTTGFVSEEQQDEYRQRLKRIRLTVYLPETAFKPSKSPDRSVIGGINRIRSDRHRQLLRQCYELGIQIEIESGSVSHMIHGSKEYEKTIEARRF